MPYHQLSDDEVEQCTNALLDVTANVTLLPTKEKNIRLTINDKIVDDFGTYSSACEAIYFLANG